jgi:uncharacterized protein
MPQNRAACPPAGTSVASLAIMLATTVVCALRMLFPLLSPGACNAVLLVLLGAALAVRALQALHLSLFCALLVITPQLLPMAFRHWPYKLLVPLASYTAVVLVLPNLRHSIRWLRRGSPKPGDRIILLVTVVIANAALVAWYVGVAPDISLHAALIPTIPLWLLPLAGAGFAVLNAAMEEAAFRGVVLQALDSVNGPGKSALAIQAALFASVHFAEGFPNGPWGFAMTFAYGIMLGVLRYRTQGLFAPWIAHVFADLTIFALVAGAALNGYT